MLAPRKRGFSFIQKEKAIRICKGDNLMNFLIPILN